MAVDLEDGREAGEDNAIPHELMQFLRGDSFSLLIKGAAGTGKTTLALTILRVLKIRKNFLYLSTRSAPVQFVQYHPWLFELFRSGKIKAKRPIDPASIPMAFVDARLDEPTPLFERITNQLMDARSPLIVVDTWDSIEEFAEGKSLQTNMRVLQTWCERARAKLILTGEDPDDKKFDALVDGVVTLKQNDLSRRIREISLSKLYGIKIDNPSYFFTLNEGRFRSFQHYRPEKVVIPATTPPAAAYSTGRSGHGRTGYIPTGYEELDGVLSGGFPPGSIVNLELASDVNPRIALLLMGNMVADFSASGRQVIVLPFEGIDREFFGSFLRAFVQSSQQRFIKQLWLHAPEDTHPSARAGPTALVQLSKALTGARETSRAEDRGSLSIFGSRDIEPGPTGAEDEGRGGGGGDQKGEFEHLVDLVRSSTGLALVVTRENDRRVTERLSTIGAARMKIIYLDGTLFLEPHVPFSRLFAITVQKDATLPTILQLEPMV